MGGNLKEKLTQKINQNFRKEGKVTRYMER